MRVLHINTFGTGGAFTGLYRLHIALREAGVDSKILIRDEVDKRMNVEVYRCTNFFRRENIINRIGFKLGIATTKYQKRKKKLKNLKNGNYEIISFPFSDIDITKSKFYKDADIINFHWVGDFVDFKTFFRKNKKPLVWTIRDSNPFMGIFHLQNDYRRNSEQWKAVDYEIREFKEKQLQKSYSKPSVVGISDFITKQTRSSDLLGKYCAKRIYNCISVFEVWLQIAAIFKINCCLELQSGLRTCS